MPGRQLYARLCRSPYAFSRAKRQMTAEVRKLAKKPHSTLVLNFLMTVLGLIGICLHSFYILTFCRQFLLVLIHKVCNKTYKTAKRKIISCLYLHFSCYIFCFISICVYLQRISKQKARSILINQTKYYYES